MKTKRQTTKKQKIALLVVLALLVAVAGALAFSHYHQKATPVVTPAPTGKSSTGNDTTVHAGPSHDASPSPTVVPPNPSHPVASTLAKPIGPDNNVQTISRTAASTMMDSTCSSVPGASCYIQATNAGQTVVVSDTKVIGDASQGVDLPWDAKKLATGTWTIQAVATSGGQKALSDPEKLTVTN